jgi:hypothetical protein
LGDAAFALAALDLQQTTGEVGGAVGAVLGDCSLFGDAVEVAIGYWVIDLSDGKEAGAVRAVDARPEGCHQEGYLDQWMALEMRMKAEMAIIPRSRVARAISRPMRPAPA